jgi:Ca2+-transporting ATPase
VNEWHRLPLEKALRQAESRLSGLGPEEAERRLALHGTNELRHVAARSPWRIILEQFISVLIVILILAAVISAVMGDHVEAGAIVAIVILNGLLGFRQEYRAEKTMAALRELAAPLVRVRRGAEVLEISAKQLVPGDIILVEAGNMISADARIIEAAALRIQESSLTGESEPIDKIADALDRPDIPLADRVNMLYMGTAVAHGRGTAMVVATGMDTELGRVAGLIQQVDRQPTPLQKRLGQLGRWLAVAALALVAVIFALGLLRGESTRVMFLTAVSMAVAAVPEGLPAIVTISLSIGAQRMLRRNALIRKLPAVETLGSVTTICSDKTGTQTENRMTVHILDVAGHEIDLDQERRRGRSANLSAADAGSFAPLLLDRPAAALLAAGSALCNDSVLTPFGSGSRAGDPADRLRAIGDPTESALVIAAAQLGLLKPDLEAAFPRVGEYPFDSDRKLMTTVHKVPLDPPSGLREFLAFLSEKDSKNVAFTKGALDSVLAASTTAWDGARPVALDKVMRSRITRANDLLASKGMRVLALGFRVLDAAAKDGSAGGWERDLVIVGLVGMIDPARPEAAEAVSTAISAGVRPVMITGDQPLTATSIAVRVGITTQERASSESFRVLTGVDLERLTAAELRSEVDQVSVYARVAPEHKLKIVQALQERDHIVAMTGDGVNDAPALRKADIGVAMGVTGTDVAKEAADMVLLDDNFATIVTAIREGRVIYDNIRKFVKYLMATNVGELAVMLVAPFLGMPLPLLPLQILWMNLVTDGLPGLALGVEPPEPNVMRRSPHPPNESIFARGLGTHILWAGPFMGIVALITGWIYWDADIAVWQTMLFTVLTISQMFHVLAIRRDRESIFATSPRSNPMLYGAVLLTLLLQFALIYTPFLQGVFSTMPLSAPDLLIAIGVSSLILFLIEALKWMDRRRE